MTGAISRKTFFYNLVSVRRNNVVTPDSTELKMRGFVFFTSAAPSQSTAHVAQSIGEVLNTSGVAAVQVLIPRQSEGLEKSSYSGMYGTNSFPLHTDMAHWHVPPRYFLLRCIEPTKDVHTYFAHSGDIFGPEAELTLKRALFRPRRRLDGRLTCFRLREGECYRWDSAFIQPVNALASELRSRILERMANVQIKTVSLATTGDCILVDNWKTLHGRSEIPRGAAHRCIERVYLTSVKI